MSNPVQEVFGPAEALPLVPLEGGPVELEVLHLQRLHRLLWFGDDSARPGVELVLPEGATLAVPWEEVDAEPEVVGSRIRVAWEETMAKWGDLNNLERLGILLKDLPAGTGLQYVAWGDSQFSRQRYQGRTVRPGVWAIEACGPAVPREVLVRALELSRSSEEDDDLVAPSEEVASQVVALANADFGGGTTQFTAEGCRIRVTDEDGTNRTMLMMTAGRLFLHTFGDHWPLQELLDGALEEAEEWSTTLSNLGQQLGQALARGQGAPPPGALVLEGKHGQWSQGNLAGLPQVIPEDVAFMDREMAALGLHLLGDLTGTPVPGSVLRGYGHPEGLCFGTATGSASGEFLYEFVTDFKDGSTLTTSTMPGQQDQPARKALKRSHPTATPAELFRLHREEVDRLAPTHQGLREAEPTLVGLARAVDEFIGKVMGK